tara:strand:+ start:1476 stop:2300 length:825 start_codon:yes stop_codon:yes gene_type:complete
MSIKQNGGVFGRNPTFNDVTIEGQLTFDGDIDINSDLKVDGDLDVTGKGTFADLNVTDAGNTYVRVKSTTSAFTGVDFGQSFGGSGIINVRDNHPLLIFTNGAETWRFDAAGNLKVKNSGNGIDFSATAGTGTSELLDDYEEGTFTPVLADATSGGNEASVLSAYGYYTKVGRVVTVTISITNPNTTGLTATNNVYITGLPFSAFSLAGGIYYTAPLAGGGNFATAGTYLGSVGDNTSYMTILKADFGGPTTFQKVSAINTGVTDIVTSLSYFA